MLLILFLGGAILYGAPKLRLSSAAIGPVDIAVGQDGATQVVEASNAGDGALALTVSSPDEWLTPTVGAAVPCTGGGGACRPVHIGLVTASLARGVHTGVVQVADPNALDAPQSITVTVQIGGGVPDAVDLYVPPQGADVLPFRTTNKIIASTTTESGGNWLSLALDGGGSFRFVLPYRVAGRDAGGLAAGAYQGRVRVTGSAFAPDVKDVPVTLHVTGGPIGALSRERLAFKAASGTLPAIGYVALANRGLGELSITQITASTVDGAPWLKAEAAAGVVKVSADPTDLAPGLYQGTVTIESNAANSPHTVPVRFDATPQGPPIAAFRGVVNNATFSPGDPVPQGGIAAVFGEQLSQQSPALGSELPLVRELGGAKVLVNGIEAPLFFSSEGQINFQMPYEIPPGEARVQIVRDSQPGNTITVRVVAKSPRILTFLGNYAIALHPDKALAVPETPGVFSRPASPGDVLELYTIGFGPTAPAVPTGEAAPLEPLSHVVPTPTLFLGSGLLPVAVTPAFAGLSPTFVGLYQVNFTIPANAPRGDHVPILIQGKDYITNQAEIAIQ